MVIKYKEKSFRSRLFHSFIIVGILPLLIMALVFYRNMDNYTSEKLNSYVMENLEISTRLIDSVVTTFASMTNYISENGEVQAVLGRTKYENYDQRFIDSQLLYKTTRDVLATQTLDVPIHIIDKNRLSRFSTTDYLVPIYQDSRGNFYDIMDKSEGKQLSYIHRRVDGKGSKDIVMVVGRQVRNKDGEFLGYVVSDIYDLYFDDILNNSKIYHGNNIYILDKTGTIITDKLFKNRTGFKFDDDYFEIVNSTARGTFKCNVDSKDYIAFFTTSEHSGLKIVELIPRSEIHKERYFIITTFVVLVAIFSLIALISSYGLSGSISRPVRLLSSLMRRVETGDRTVTFDLKTNDEIGHLGKSFNGMVREINRLIEEVYVKQYLLQAAEFKALKAQVNPHFLYNTLQSIDWMAKLNDSEGISTMVTALGKFLRYSISNQGDIVTVKQEIEQIENYLTIQKIRYKDKLSVSLEIHEEILDKKILKLLLQPIVENAIIHGLEQKLGKGCLVIRGYLEKGNVIFEVLDDGVGMNNSAVKGEGIGMENVDRRIKINYGDGYGVSVEPREGFTCIKITVCDKFL